MIPKLTYDALLARVADDPAVVGLVLKGSHAHDGMATEHSDHDVYVVVATGAVTVLSELDGYRSAELDVLVISVDDFRRIGGHERYALARARTVIDRLDGEIAEIVAAKGRRSSHRLFRAARGRLTGARSREADPATAAPSHRVQAPVRSAAPAPHPAGGGAGGGRGLSPAAEGGARRRGTADGDETEPDARRGPRPIPVGARVRAVQRR